MPSAIVAFLSPVTPDAAAATLTVGPSGTYAAIHDALFAAASGDMLEVEPGTYREQAVDLSIDVDIMATGRAAATTWDIDGDATDGLTWYADSDGDGFGIEASSDVACTQPEGHVSAAGDCDDSMVGIHPDAPEVCDGIDNDCDGAVNDAVKWWPDCDGDGFGDATAESNETCDGADGQVDNGLDCDDDDDDDDIHPDADDPAGDGIDSNCDGTDGLGCDPDADERLVVGAGRGCESGSSAAPVPPMMSASIVLVLAAHRRW